MNYTLPHLPLLAIITDDHDDDDAPLCFRDPVLAAKWAEKETNRTGIAHKVVTYA
jgi:hypothetical protein